MARLRLAFEWRVIEELWLPQACQWPWCHQLLTLSNSWATWASAGYWGCNLVLETWHDGGCAGTTAAAAGAGQTVRAAWMTQWHCAEIIPSHDTSWRVFISFFLTCSFTWALSFMTFVNSVSGSWPSAGSTVPTASEHGKSHPLAGEMCWRHSTDVCRVDLKAKVGEIKTCRILPTSLWVIWSNYNILQLKHTKTVYLSCSNSISSISDECRWAANPQVAPSRSDAQRVFRAAAAQEPLPSFKTPRQPRHSRSPPVSASPVPCQMVTRMEHVGPCRENM